MGSCCSRSTAVPSKLKPAEPTSLETLQTFYSLSQTQICRKLRPWYEKALNQQESQVTELNLQFSQLNSGQIPFLVCILKFFTQVTTLKLWKANIGAEGMKQLALGMKELRGLEKVGMEGNHLRDEGIQVFSQTISEFTQLKELYVQDNEFGDSGAESLSQSLQNKPLTVLNLSENSITATGLEHLLRACPSLEVLELAHNHVGPAGGQLLLKWWPSRLVRLTVTGNAIGDEWEQALLRQGSTTQVLI